MRTLLAFAIAIAAALALNAATFDATAETGQKSKRVESKRFAKKPSRAPQAPLSREEVECERAWHADPTGTYANYPCWAREALSPNTGPGFQ